VDKKGDFLKFVKTLVVFDLAQRLIRDYVGDFYVPGRSRSMTFDENCVCNIWNATINQDNLYYTKW
jgi:hypothetical protein